MEEFLRSASRRELDKIASRPNEMVASKMSTFALRQMQKMGWSECVVATRPRAAPCR